MRPMEALLPNLFSWGTPLVVTLIVTIAVYWLIGKTFANQPNNRLYRQLAYIGLFVVAMIVLVLVLPFADQTQEQLLSLFGLVLTAVIALSSTTFVANAMAGLMLKAMGIFHTGDFIRVAGHFGRVTEKALLHTELQSEDRDMVNLPNLFVITNPVQVVDQSGTLISAEVGIGFDVHRRRVRDQLLSAAEDTELTDAFVHIVEIGNYAVTYRITGFLEDVGTIVSKRSDLKANVLDALHRNGIEVMTPTIMNQRPVEPQWEAIPKRDLTPERDNDSGKAERMMFDKAELAARIERFREQCVTLEAEIKSLKQAQNVEDGREDSNRLEIAWREHQLESLRDIVTKFDNADD